MKYTLNQFWPVLPRIYYNQRHFIWSGKFAHNCANFDEQNEVSILCGINTFKNKLRIGWRFNQLTKRVDLFVCKNRNFDFLTSVELDTEFIIELFLHPDKTAQFIANNRIHLTIPFEHRKIMVGYKPNYWLNVTPHKMHIHLTQML
jgi:hypothetical protein